MWIYDPKPIVIPNGSNVSPTIDAKGMAMIAVHIPATLLGSVGIQVLQADGTTWDWFRDNGRDGTTLAAIAAVGEGDQDWTGKAGWYNIPVDVYPHSKIRLATFTGTDAGVAKNQTADVTLEYCAKAI